MINTLKAGGLLIIPIIVFLGILWGCGQANNISLTIVGFIVGIVILLVL